ncbi:MAG TPA: AAA family ATPase [Methylomirabilota bacterium]
MTTSCLACGAAVAPGSRFCQACGQPQPGPAAALLSPRFASPVTYTPRHLAERILDSRSALEGEHKRVTVVFCDIVESSALAARLGRERMHDLLQRFFDLALEEVHRYEGTVNQFLGDGFMALFGAPLALERHERQAVLAAVAVHERVRLELPVAAGLPEARLALRTGINSGLVVVGRIGDNLRMDYTAIGETTNVAARLQALAERGGILVAQTTWERARDLVESRPREPIVLKERAEPIRAYDVTGTRAGRTAEPLRSLTPFIGRAHEMLELHEALDHAQKSRGQAVAIVGEAGMGKSRLLFEFRRTLRARGVLCLDGGCLPYGSTIPYLPILDLVRGAFGIVPGDTPETMAGKATRGTEDLGADPATAVPYLLHLLGVKERTAPLEALSPQAIKSRTSEVLGDLVLRASRRRPLVIVVEDMHWIDQASEEFLTALIDVLPAAAILFVATYRPGYGPAWIQRSYATQVALRALADREAQALVRQLAGADMTEVDAQALVARGEGNPLFLEELVQAMDRAPDDAGAIPQTLLGVLTARVDRLPDDVKEVLQMAAVIGRRFGPGLLAQLLSRPEGLDLRLRELTQLEFIHQLTVGPEPEYAFKHTLTRDAVYHSLLERRRRAAHRAVGQALERRYEGRTAEVVELLAYHFELGDDGERAVDYAIGAAERAQRRWANAEALGFFEQAVRRLATLPATTPNLLRRIDAVTKQAEVLFALGRHRDHVAVLEGIADIVHAAGDPPRRAIWHFWLGFLHSLTGARPEVAIAHCRTASDLADGAGLQTVRAYAHTGLAQAYVIAGELRPAIEAGEQALAVFESQGDAWWASRALSQLSPAANYLGEWERGLRYCRRAVELGEAVNDLRLRVSGLVRTASTHVHRGDPQAAMQLLDDALALKPTPFDAAAVRAVRGYSLVKSGALAEGAVQLQEALTFYEQSRLRYTWASFSLWLADAHLRLGALDTARAVVDEVLRTALELGYRFVEGVARRLAAEVMAGADAQAAGAELAAAEAILRQRDARNELAKVWVAQACLGRPVPDRALLTRALALFRQLGTVDEPAHVERLLRTAGA